MLPVEVAFEPLLAHQLDRVLLVEQRAYDHPWSVLNFLDALQAGYQAQMLVADDTVLGYFVAMQGVEEVHLLNITVAPEYQRQGWSRVMLDALALWARGQAAQWVWLDGSQLRQQPATGSKPPEDIAGKAPRLLKRTELADNDAGVRLTYANYTQRTGMLERIRHYPPHTYAQLMRLDADFAAQGPLHGHVRGSFGLSAGEFDRVVANVRSAAATLRKTCRAGQLRFDLDTAAFLRDGKTDAQRVDCDNPTTGR